MSRGGFSLIELMVACTVAVIFISVAAVVATQTLRTDAISAEYSADLRACRASLSSIERDLRAARSVEVEASGLRIVTPEGGVVAYEHRGDTLFRSEGGARRELTRRIRGVRFSREGSLVHVIVRLPLRSGPPARVSTAVAIRGGGRQ